MPQFSHLHVHTQFSLLDGAADIKKLFGKAKEDNMPAMAITDHGNMFGAFKFVAEAKKFGVKPIVGCEFYMVEDRHKKQFTKENRDIRFHQLLLAKNEEGYRNLSKLCSLGFMEGLYSKWPRIDKELLLKYHKGLIATTCCLGAEVPQAILNKGEKEAEIIFKWWLDIFGEDYYVEFQRHDIPDQDKVNAILIKFAKKYNVKVICSNDSHYVDQEDANAHDILLCVNTGDVKSTPIATDEEGGKGYRFGFPNDQFYFKTQAQMEELFHDIPEALDNTNEIVDKVDVLDLKRDILLPNFPVPAEFSDQDQYLKHLTFEGAKQRYKEINAEVEERLNFELFTIRTMGFAGYFLIVSDFIKAGRQLGVLVGPGRGSAAGSAVAYCLGITNIDPIKYNLLFERFLNPDRKSMPDIDTDFDDEGRQKVIDYVVDKYGRNQVAQIITYGSMAAKMSIKDVARALELPLQDSNYLTKLVPDAPGTNLGYILRTPIKSKDPVFEKMRKEDVDNIQKLQEIYAGNSLQSKVLQEAEKLEGSVRNVGIHAAGVIIAPQDLTDLLPITTAKDSPLLVTQFDGSVVESAGVIKMDFLGLKTLSIIKDALQQIHKNHGVLIDIDAIPLDDTKTFELLQKGNTVGIFQFEAAHLQPILREMKPTSFEDLIALNALNRPGPMAYIPDYIAIKHGRKKVQYDLPIMEEILSETYGITVYQEQVMLLSQKLANFTKGDADVLRKAMGKKEMATLAKMKPQFLEGCAKNGHDTKSCEKIWVDWEAFASYAFNKSHSTCYALVAYQTAYLKAHYPAEFMSAILNNQNNIEKITFFMDECRHAGIPVLGPDVNESSVKFTVNKKGEIRFGLAGIKGIGEKAVESIIEERNENGLYEDIFDFARRSNPRNVNKKAYENLVYSGAFDCFKNFHRSQYFGVSMQDRFNGIERIMKYGSDYQTNAISNQHSLFGESGGAEISEPTLPDTDPWPLIEALKFEKEVIGMYISGHPLDEYRLEIKNFTNTNFADLINHRGEFKLAGIVTESAQFLAKNGNPYGRFTVEDYTGSFQFSLFKDAYLKYKHLTEIGTCIYLKGKVSERRDRPGEFEPRIDEIQLLSNIKDQLAKQLTISVDVNGLNEELIENLNVVLMANPGKCALKIIVVDNTERIKVDLASKSVKVSVSNELIVELEKLQSVKCDLN